MEHLVLEQAGPGRPRRARFCACTMPVASGSPPVDRRHGLPERAQELLVSGPGQARRPTAGRRVIRESSVPCSSGIS